MKRRIVAIITAAPILLVMLMVAPSSIVVSASDLPESLVQVTHCTISGAPPPDVSEPGRTANFRVTVSIPASFPIEHFINLRITMGAGSAFALSGGVTSFAPFSDRNDYVPSLVSTNETFTINTIYTGSGNDLVLTVSHPTGTTPATASSDFGPYFISQTIPSSPPSMNVDPPGPNLGATPRLSLSGNVPNLEAGKAGNISFTLTNNSTHTARGVIVELGGTEEILRPTTLAGNSVSIGEMRINGDTRTRNVTIPVEVLEDVDQGYYTIPMQITMTNVAGVALDQTVNLQIFVRNPDTADDIKGESSLSLVSATVSNNNPGSDGLTTLTLTIANIGDAPANNARITLTGFMSSVITLNENIVTKSLGNIASGDQVTVTYSLRVASALESGSYPLNVEVRYRQPDDTEGSLTDIAHININRPEKPEDPDVPENPNTSTPRVIISRHSLSVETVNAGKPFELSFTLLNTSASMNVGNMQVTVSDENGIFIPVEGVSSFYIASLPMGQTTDISITLMPRLDAETKSHPVTIHLEYEDPRFTPHAVTASLSIPVITPQRLEVINLAFYDNGMGMAELSFQFVNEGMAPLHNLKVRIEGPMSASEGDMIVGQFPAGQFDYFEDMIIPQMGYGELEGEIVLAFEDSSGAPHELRHPISTFISETFWPDPGEGWPGDRWPEEILDGSEEEGWPDWVIWAIIGGSVLAGLIITVIIVKKIRRKKHDFLDDDDTDYGKLSK